jgi:hypothetical protein
MVGIVSVPLTELMLTIAPREVRSSGYLPRPAFTISRATAWPTRNEPLTLTRITASKSASVTSRKSAALKMPALLTSTSMRPCAARGARDQHVHVGLVADVAVHVDPAEFGCQRLARRVGQIGQHHVGAFAREAAGAGLADALGAAGDDDDAAVVAEVDLAGIGCGHGEVSWMK